MDPNEKLRRLRETTSPLIRLVDELDGGDGTLALKLRVLFGEYDQLVRDSLGEREAA